MELQLSEILESLVSGIDVSDISNVDTLHFDFGNYIEIANKLSLKNRNNQKYPLFALILDVEENESENLTVYKSFNFRMVIAYHTVKNYTSKQRRDNIFKPILQPLYRKLINAFIDSTSFNIANGYIEHTKYDRYFLGTSAENQNRLNDYVDAIEIEIRNLEINKQTNC